MRLADKKEVKVTWWEKSYETKTGWVYRAGKEDTVETDTIVKEVKLEVWPTAFNFSQLDVGYG